MNVTDCFLAVRATHTHTHIHTHRDRERDREIERRGWGGRGDSPLRFYQPGTKESGNWWPMKGWIILFKKKKYVYIYI